MCLLGSFPQHLYPYLLFCFKARPGLCQDYYYMSWKRSVGLGLGLDETATRSPDRDLDGDCEGCEKGLTPPLPLYANYLVATRNNPLAATSLRLLLMNTTAVTYYLPKGDFYGPRRGRRGLVSTH